MCIPISPKIATIIASLKGRISNGRNRLFDPKRMGLGIEDGTITSILCSSSGMSGVRVVRFFPKYVGLFDDDVTTFLDGTVFSDKGNLVALSFYSLLFFRKQRRWFFPFFFP